jgi:NAD(P)H-hydrate epimerase
VYLGVPEGVYPIAAAKLHEPVVFPLPQEDGMLSQRAGKEILSRLSSADAVLIGPGLGKSEGVRACVRTVLENSRVPVVVDADGINVLAGHIDILRGSACPVILTPHPGEFRRLGGDDRQGREQAAMDLAKDLGCICVLKGSGTVVTDGTGCFVNPTGNPGMAVGGSGDVLAGMLASLLGQGLNPMDAACAAVWLHGAAGDVCARELGQYGMLPSDMLMALPRLLP